MLSSWRSFTFIGLTLLAVLPAQSNTTPEPSLDEQLLVAATFDDHEQVAQLLKKGANPNIHDAKGFTPLIHAARLGNLTMAQSLKSYGAKINDVDDKQDSALAWACFNGHQDVVEFLLKNKAHVNVRDWQGDTALMGAARKGHLAIVELLLAHKASIHNENHKGQTALTLAKAGGHTSIVLLLHKLNAPTGSNPDEALIDMLNQLNELPIPTATKKEILRIIQQIKKAGPIANVMDPTLQPFLELVFSLPWGTFTTDNLDLDNAKKVLDEDHYGLDEVKEKILDHIATMNFKKEGKTQIICLVGAPGIGKTSLGKSIARALGRKYVRIAVGGLYDESEIRGHRRTYISARPGKILYAFKQAQSMNPVIVIDEIDKMGLQNHHGDPAAAMLEVLDPEQNFEFRDNYLEAPFDISRALFITTANDVSNIPAPLRDRMEIIELDSYGTAEKVAIAQNHLIVQAIKEAGLENKNIKISKEVLEHIIENYVLEGGVRQLKRTIARLMAKVARGVLKDGKTITITPENLKTYLGEEKYKINKLFEINHVDEVGVSNCLAAIPTLGIGTAFKTEVLLVPRNKGDDILITTGQLGPMAQESNTRALSFVRSHAQKLGFDSTIFDSYAIHINICDKLYSGVEGPSAGIGQVVALVSALTNRKTRSDYAMTGAINLRGHAQPIGGLKEKISAAKKVGMKYVIVPEDNRADVEDLDDYVTKGIEIIFVRHVDEALKLVLM